jgi:type II secretory ATPase GspE/PulE/Tfp pilus assembly ATPase PilB-like protein
MPKSVQKDNESEKLSIQEELAQPIEKISVIRLVDKIVERGYLARASDIHVDPAEDKIEVRLRIDGALHNTFVLPKDLQDEVISRIKVLSGLRTDEHQAAQDGRFRFQLKETRINFDIRVSIAPTFYGENAVLRLLAERGEEYTLETLGFSARDLEAVKRAIKKPYGMILATGPTGSGKTTTLYTILKTLNIEEISIITIEDPIEYSIKGIDQIQVNPQTGLTFASGLRSILRQDPNIVMVGEIRDEETAGIAVNAALTGHLLLSTLHTNDAATTLPRLIDMKVEPFLIASTVNIAIGQRLVRKICQDCKTEKKLSLAELQGLATVIPEEILDKNKNGIFYYGKGCKNCNNTGYRGRLGIYEVLEVTDALREAIMKRLNANEIREIAQNEGMTPMLEDGFNKALKGITTIEEILRVIHE